MTVLSISFYILLSLRPYYYITLHSTGQSSSSTWAFIGTEDSALLYNFACMPNIQFTRLMLLAGCEKTGWHYFRPSAVSLSTYFITLSRRMSEAMHIIFQTLQLEKDYATKR